MHDPTKVLMGVPLSSARDVSRHDSDPATFIAGLAVSMNGSGLSLLKSVGPRIGISLGKSLSDTKKTAVARTGESVPLRAALKRATGVITISSYADLVSGTPDSITVGATVFTAQSGAATPGDATFRAATSNDATATSLAAQINAHATAGALVWAVASSATVTLYSKVSGAGSTGTGNDIALVYTNNDGNVGATLSGLSGGKLSGGSNTLGDIAYITLGAKVYINNFTGEADANVSGVSSISDAVYKSAALTAVEESGVESGAAAVLVDMPGGL